MTSWYEVSPAGEAPPEDITAQEEARAYDRFRTGLTFGDVRRLLAVEQRQARDEGQYLFVSRSTVLGRWHEIKNALWRGEQIDLEVDCAECGEVVDLEDICVDCGECHPCCNCEWTPEDTFWTDNPWGGERWLLDG